MSAGALARASAVGAAPVLIAYLVAFIPLLTGRVNLAPAGPTDPLSGVSLLLTGLVVIVLIGAVHGLIAGLVAIGFSAPGVLERRARLIAAALCCILFSGFALRYFVPVFGWAAAFGLGAGLLVFLLLPWVCRAPVVATAGPLVQRHRPATTRRLLFTLGGAGVGLLIAQDILWQVSSISGVARGVGSLGDLVGVGGALLGGVAVWITLPERR